jgi:hypothetical protein
MRRRVRQPSDACRAFPCSRCPCVQCAGEFPVGGKLRGNRGNHIPCRHGTCRAVFAGGQAFSQSREWHRACPQASCCHGRWHLSAARPVEYRAGHKMPFRPRLAAIRWIWARGGPPFFAGIDDESTQTRLKSILLARRRRRSNSSCNLSQTPASCQSRRRRQQVTPEPQPSSGGKSSHAMPVRSTTRIPLSAARSEMRGRPPRGFDAGAGRTFSIIGHRPSGIRTEGIPLYESAIPRRTRVLEGALSSLALQALRLTHPRRARLYTPPPSRVIRRAQPGVEYGGRTRLVSFVTPYRQAGAPWWIRTTDP